MCVCVCAGTRKGALIHTSESTGAGHTSPLCYCCLVAKSCPTLCNPVDYSPPGSSVHEISQARIQKWTAISSCRGLPNPGIEPPESPALAGRFFTTQILILVYDKCYEGVGDMLYRVAKEGITEEVDF